MKCHLQLKRTRARHFAKGDSRKPALAIKVQIQNHLSTLKSSNRCMVNKMLSLTTKAMKAENKGHLSRS